MTPADRAAGILAKPDGARPSVFTLACWALCVLPVGIAVWFVQGFSLTMPLFDHWTLLPILTRLAHGEFRFSDLFWPHNGLHVAPFVKLILAALASVSGWSFRTEIFVGFALVIYTAFILNRAFEECLPGSERRETRAIVTLLTVGLLFSPAQDWIWTWSIGFFHYFENASVATVVWALSKRTPRLGVAILGCTLATFNRFEGMFTWFVFLPAVFFAVQRLEHKARAWIAWGTAGALSCGACTALIISARPLELAGVGASSSLNVVARLNMAASLAGMSAGFFTESHGQEKFAAAAFLPAGVALFVVFLTAGAALVRLEKTRSTAAPFLCFGGFGMAFVLATALARQGVANPTTLPLMRCYLSSYSATASLFGVATLHAVALFFANRASPRGISEKVLRRGAAVFGICILAADYAHAAPLLHARRIDGHWDHYCVELAPYFADRSTCFMPPGGGPALVRSGFRTAVQDVEFEPDAPPAGRLETGFISTEPFSGGEVPAFSGHADIPNDTGGTVLLAFGDDHRFVGQASQTTAEGGRMYWVAKLPWAYVTTDPRPIHAWLYDRARRAFLPLAGEARPSGH